MDARLLYAARHHSRILSVADNTISLIRGLSPRLQGIASILVYVFRANGVPLKITSGRRTFSQQKRLVEAGRSRTLNSRHLSGLAFDVDIEGWNRDDIPRAFWPIIGEVGEYLGLTWGGRWKNPYDPGHFEL